MKKMMILVCLLMAVLTACGTPEQPSEENRSPVVQQEQPEVQELTPLEETAALLQAASSEPTVNSVGGEWLILGLARSGADVPETYFEQYYKNVEDFVVQCGGVLHERKYSEYSRVILALTAIGKDPTNVAGYDLTKPLANFDQTCFQGVNGPMFALIALNSGNYEMPVADEGVTQATKDMYVDFILEKQLENGGWCMAGDQMDVDVTAMALQALANYRDREDVAAAVERGLEALSQAQNENGGFSGNDGESCESIAQAIVALTELGISLEDVRFVKGEETLQERMNEFRLADGGYCHLLGDQTNQMATEQAFYALTAAYRAEQGMTSLYDMSDVG